METFFFWLTKDKEGVVKKHGMKKRAVKRGV